MKWKNKEHEYDKYIPLFKDRKIYIYGAGSKGKYLFERLGILNCVDGFIDNDPALQKSGFCGMPVIPYCEIKAEFLEKNIIIIAARLELSLEFAIQCRKAGFVDGSTLFYWEDFLRYYYDIYAFYHNGLVCADFISIQITSVCNLNCNGCEAFIPFDKDMRHYSLKEIIQNIDAVFSNINYVRTLDLCGGEPFLAPEFYQAIEYVGKHYRNRIEYLRTVSNGTVVPNDHLCEVMLRNRMMVLLDDYRENVPLSKKNFELVYNKLNEKGVHVVVNKVDKWIHLGIEDGEKVRNKESVIGLFDQCNNTRFEVHDKKLYACDYAAYASKALIYPDSACEQFLLNNNVSRTLLFEYLKGYTESGESGMCSFCNGGAGINRCFLGVAEQVERKREK